MLHLGGDGEELDSGEGRARTKFMDPFIRL